MKQAETPLQIGMLLYPGLTLLDLIGPATVFSSFSMEYDPEPPFESGNPKTADPALVQRAMSFMAAAIEKQAGQRQHRMAT
jgi:hypothetical protein